MFCCVCLHTKSVHVRITLIYSILGRWGLEYCFLPKTFKIILPIYFLCKQQVENYSFFLQLKCHLNLQRGPYVRRVGRQYTQLRKNWELVKNGTRCASNVVCINVHSYASDQIKEIQLSVIQIETLFMCSVLISIFWNRASKRNCKV